MDKKEFIDRFCDSDALAERHRIAEERSQRLVKFDLKKEVKHKENIIDGCEMCLHPRGTTFNVMEICPSFQGDIAELLDEFDRKSRAYYETKILKADHSNLVKNLVIPPDPKMIMELGKHVEKLMELGDFTVTVYDPKSDKMGACPMDRDFLESLKDDPDYEGMDLPEIFTNFMMNFSELL